MADSADAGSAFNQRIDPSTRRSLIPMTVGDAVVYISQAEETELAPSDLIYPVALPTPREAFESALGVIKECVGMVASRIKDLGEALRPEELSIEFSIEFEGTGTARIVPVLVTAQTKAATGLKVTAVWKHPPRSP